jgi:hypothetical protein
VTVDRKGTSIKGLNSRAIQLLEVREIMKN